MKLEFKNKEYERIDNFKGGEGHIMAKMFFDGKNRVLIAKVEPGSSIGVHTHDVNAEMIFIEKGEPLFIIDGREERLEAGNVHYCPKGSTHTMINDTDEVIEIKAVIFEQ